MLHQAAGDSAPAGVEGRAVVGQQALGHAPGGYALVEDVDGRLTGLARGDQGGHRQAGVVVLELEDHRLAPAGQDVLAGIRARRRALGAGQTNRRHAALGLLDGSAPPRPLPTGRSLASHAGEGASRPMAAILSCTLIGPWSSPERSRAARTSRARARTRSGRRLGLVRGRRDRGSSTAAGPSSSARRRKT